MNPKIAPAGGATDRPFRFGSSSSRSPRGQRPAQDPFQSQLDRIVRPGGAVACSACASVPAATGEGGPEFAPVSRTGSSGPAAEPSGVGDIPGAAPLILASTLGLPHLTASGAPSAAAGPGAEAARGGGAGEHAGGGVMAGMSGEVSSPGGEGTSADGAVASGTGSDAGSGASAEGAARSPAGEGTAGPGKTGAGRGPGGGGSGEGAPSGEGEKSADTTGTGSAVSRELMNGADLMTETAGGQMQEALQRAGAGAGGSEEGSAGRTADAEGVDPAMAAAAAARYAGAESGSLLAESGEASEVLTPPSAVVDATERIAELTGAVVGRIHRIEGGGYEVELRPDGQTELVLRVVLVDGGAEVHAELRRGDAEAFAGRWKELQDRLAEQGVQLADWSAGGSGGSAGESPARGRDSGGDDDFGFGLGAPARRAASTADRREPVAAGRGRGGDTWETWA